MKNWDQLNYENQQKYKILTDLICDNLDDILTHYDIEFNKYNRYYSMACPIHGGDNESACVIYPDGHTSRGYWKCNTHNCEKTFKSTAIGFIRGILSNKLNGWSNVGDQVYSFQSTIDHICELFKIDWKELKINKIQSEDLEKNNFTKNINTLNKKPNHLSINQLSRKELYKLLKIPCPYFLERGFSSKILEKFCIGFCSNPTKPMYNRTIVPVLEDTGNYVVGCLGRSIYKLCDKCKLYHNPSNICPNKYEPAYAKWINQKNWKAADYLYNWWNAALPIRDTKIIILTESVGNVLRFEEAGILNSVALFTNKISDIQQIKLEMSGAMHVIISLDNDQAGIEGANLIKDKLAYAFNSTIIFPPAQFNDVAEMTVEQVKEFYNPIIERVKQNYE